MSLLRNLKNKITTIESYIRSNAAMKSVASVRMSKCRKKITAFNEIDSIILDVAVKLKEGIKKTAHIIIGCNQGMCGSFLGNLSTYIKYVVQNREKNDVIFIMGEKFLEYKIPHKIYTEKLELSNGTLFKLGAKMFKFIIKNNVTDVFFHYFDKNGIQKKHFIESRDPESLYSVFDLLKFVLMLIKASFISGFLENKERVMALELAKNNAKSMQKKTYNELNRVRQDSITNDLAEIVAGVLL